MSEANRCLNRIEELSSNDEENREEEYPLENEQRKSDRYSSSNHSEVGSSIPTGSLDNHGNVQSSMNAGNVFTSFHSFSRFNEDGDADREDDLNGNSSPESAMKIESSTSSATSTTKSFAQPLPDFSRLGSAADAPSVGFRRRSAPVTRDMRPDPVMVKMLKKIRDIRDDSSSDVSDSSSPSDMNRTM
ncbi:unnamed protein product [Auanema sp. JU1783]|nr:unnamed protein product [Auanema sp. JU1783]